MQGAGIQENTSSEKVRAEEVKRKSNCMMPGVEPEYQQADHRRKKIER